MKIVVKKRNRKRTFNLDKYKLTDRQQKFVAGVASGLNPHDAASEAGYCKGIAASPNAAIVNKFPKVRRALMDIMDEVGLTDEELLAPVADALTATKPAPIGLKGELPDHKIRLRASEMGLRLRGHMAQQVDVTHTTETFEQRLQRLGMGGSSTVDAEFEEIMED